MMERVPSMSLVFDNLFWRMFHHLHLQQMNKSCAVNIFLESWVLIGKHQPEHFYKNEKFKIGTEWKEFTMKVSIPSDATKYPDLAQRLMRVSLNGEKNAEGDVVFDGMEFGLAK